MKTSSAKQKGRLLQQKVRDDLLGQFSDLEPDDIKSTSMGAQGEDIQLSPAARKILPIAIETKARRSIAVGRFYEQAQEHALDCKYFVDPVLVIKEDRKGPLAVISLDFLIALLYNQHLYKKAFLQQEQEISKQALKEKRMVAEGEQITSLFRYMHFDTKEHIIKFNYMKQPNLRIEVNEDGEIVKITLLEEK